MLVSQRVYHNIKCGTQSLCVYSQCCNHKGVPLCHCLTMFHPSEQAIGTQLNVLQSLSEALQHFTVRSSCYFSDIYTQFFAFTFFSKEEAEALNRCKGLQTPCQHAWLSRSSGPIKLVFSSLISLQKPQIPMHYCGFILLLLVFTLFSKALLRSLSFTLALLLSTSSQIHSNTEGQSAHLSNRKQSLGHSKSLCDFLVQLMPPPILSHLTKRTM